MSEELRFYVYTFSDEGGTVYVGKGSGKRFAHQCRRFFPAHGEIVERFSCEDRAYRAERKYIADMNPRVNVHPGGNGSRTTPQRKERMGKFEKLIGKIGTRAYAARILLAVAKVRPDLVCASKVEDIRLVAYG